MFFNIVTLIFVVVAGIQGSDLDTRFQQLESTFQELYMKNQVLRNKLKVLEQNVIKSPITLEEPNVFKRQPAPANVGFTASVGVYNLTNIGSMQTIVFDSIVSNAGYGYDRATGIFRAPTAGIYAFTVDMSVDINCEGDLHIIKAVNGYVSDVSPLYAGGTSSRVFSTSSRSIVLSLGQRDEVWVRNGFTRPIELHGNGFTTFTGYLIHSS